MAARTRYSYGLQYVSRRTGRVHTYETVRTYETAAVAAHRALSQAGHFSRDGKRWQAGAEGRRYQNRTVQTLIARGLAVRVGNVVRPA